MPNDTIKAFLSDNPRMIGVLFMVLLLLSQVGTVAGSNSTWGGP